MFFICKHVHIELRKFIKFCIAHLPVEREMDMFTYYGHIKEPQ